MFIAVDLPEPEGPMMRDEFMLPDRQINPIEGADCRLP